jgi:iron uptake system EfeUOB component EfeO/EfeM
MEIIGNIAKQKEDIDKVLKDTKELQKEINNLTGQLDRSFTIADELIFQVKYSFFVYDEHVPFYVFSDSVL